LLDDHLRRLFCRNRRRQGSEPRCGLRGVALGQELPELGDDRRVSRAAPLRVVVV